MPEVCTISKLVARETKAAEKACPEAIVGEGKTDVEIAFPEQPAITVHSKLVAFNGGVKGGVTTILIHAFLKNPVSAAVVTTVKVSKIHKGRFGTKSVASVPVIAGGNGSPVFFELNVKRKFTYKGKPQVTCSPSAPMVTSMPGGPLSSAMAGISLAKLSGPAPRRAERKPLTQDG